jgi:L-alanine-DL-glutamate epimerase-like enolase superfamily enzyme
MKIERLETFLVSPRWLFLKLTTDEGLCGWGEASLEGRTDGSHGCARTGGLPSRSGPPYGSRTICRPCPR